MKTRTFSVAAEQLHNFTGILEDNDLPNRIIGLDEEDNDDLKILFEVDYTSNDRDAILELMDEIGEEF